MDYVIHDGKFTSSFRFEDEMDKSAGSIEQREGILKARYGDKPILYPSLSKTREAQMNC